MTEPATTQRGSLAPTLALARTLAATLVFVPAIAYGQADGQDRAAATIAVYHDDNDVTVVSPAAVATHHEGPLSTTVRVGIDAISAASVDLVTAASPAGFRETRFEAGAAATYDLRSGRGADINVGYSHEPDFETLSAGLGGRTEILHRQVTVTGAYGLGQSFVGRKDDDAFGETRRTHRVDLGWSQILTPRLVGELGLGVTRSDGYHANPYRLVRIYAPGAEAHATAVAEALPADRLRSVVTLRVRARPAHRLFVVGDYRYHVDDWGLRSHTVTARATVGVLADGLDLSIEGRGYTQTAVAFYRTRYETFPDVPRLRTFDKELGAMRSVLGGLALDHTWRGSVIGSLRAGVGFSVVRWSYLDFPPLTHRVGLVSILDMEWRP